MLFNETDMFKPIEEWIEWTANGLWTIQAILYFYQLIQNTWLWQWERRHFIGSSGLAELIGTSHYITVRDAIRKKLGVYRNEYHDPNTSKTFFDHGHKYEDVTAFLFNQLFPEFILQTVGIIVNNNWPDFGASIDRIISNYYELLVEIKCPWYTVHTDIPDEYMTQMQMQMKLSGRKRCFFVSCLVPRTKEMKGKINVFIFEQSDEYWAEVERRWNVIKQALIEQNINFNKPNDWKDMPECEYKLLESQEFSYDEFIINCMLCDVTPP